MTDKILIANAKREGRKQALEDVRKIIMKLGSIGNCKYADNDNMRVIQREELLEKLNKLEKKQ